MPHWGVSLANGPHINNPGLDEPHARAAYEALGRARSRAARAGDVDRGLIDALATRYAWPPPDDRRPLDEAYATAMAKLHARFPDDVDVAALYAEALLDLRPWDQWTPEGKPQPGTDEVLAVLSSALARAPGHLLANHLWIHAAEASPYPEQADAAAERLRTLAPGLGHLLHMPSHIDVRRGRWQAAIDANLRASAADAKRPRAAAGFYNLYMAHNHHMRAFAAMMVGQKQVALTSMRQLVADMPHEWLAEHALIADGFSALPFEVMLRFGEWDAALAEPEPAAHLPLSRALRLYARGVARAAKGDVDGARAEQRAFRAVEIPEEATFGTNPARDLAAIAEPFLEGEILLREGKLAEAIAALEQAVRREDALRYDEPPGWLQPTRHALGAVLMKAERFADAERVYRADLERRPENGWSLFGLGQALRAQGKPDDDVERRFRAAWANADTAITSSCRCTEK
jgi:tetratricopeptide (TPR) repeat protein